MKKTLYLSVFGLNLALINELKAVISDILAKNYELSWTHIADPKLNFLFIYESFIELPNIQKILHNKIHYLKLSKQTQLNSILHDNCLSLPLQSTHELEAWFNDHLNKQAPESTRSQQAQTLFEQKISYLHLKEIQEKIDFNSSKGKYTLEQNGQLIALIDFDQYQLIQPTFQLQSDQRLCIQHATLASILAAKQHPISDLKQGLWQLYWNILKFESPTYRGCYQTQCWPRSQFHEEQAHFLQLAAYFSKGAEIQFVHEQTQLSLPFIHQFLMCCELVQACEEISLEQAKFKSHSQTPSATPLRGFFQKLRKKLGL